MIDELWFARDNLIHTQYIKADALFNLKHAL